tara:strand:- start:397 stop:1554 length:1158 start_codon:yes stop_codon:yes gene_type:complete
MLTSEISFKNFRTKKEKFNSKINKKLKFLIKEKSQLILSLGNNYNDNFSKKLIKKYNRYKNFKVIGMGGSSLGAQTIYDFLKDKIKKNFFFIDNLNARSDKTLKNDVNLVVSKSGNTIETIINSNILIKRKQKNIFITENKKNYLRTLGEKLKADIINHNNFIGGRYSVLSEVGMLPAELMGLKSKDFRQLNSLIKNKKFLNALVQNVSSTLNFIKYKKLNSIIINYDAKSENLFKWYQQLIAESLGKHNKGLLPIISSMPKDNHSLMQLYLDGFKNNFFTFFYVHENISDKINSKSLLPELKKLKNKNASNITLAQKKATENVFKKRSIPFRSFEVKKRSEKTLGELFCFFLLETILLGKALKLNPYDQPSVELIKKETTKLLF